jgi:alpha-1,2-mannosyltransferase
VVAVAAIAACWISAGTSPFEDAARGAHAPADFARDYVAARARLENGRGSPPAGEDGNRLAARVGAPRVELLGAPYLAHPPPATLATLPLAVLSWPAAAAVWAALAAVALVWLAASLLAIAAPERTARPATLLAASVLLALWPPTLYCLEKGQWSLWLAALMAGGLCAFQAGRSRKAGVLFGLAAALKVTPVVILALFARRDRRAAVAMLATLAGALLAAALVVGPAALTAFLAESGSNARAWVTWTANTASLAGVFARLTSQTQFARPLLTAPALGRAAFAVTGALALGAAAWVTLRGGDVRNPRNRDRAAAVWMALTVILNPLGWGHALLLMLPSLAVLWRQRDERRAALVIAALFTLPRQVLAAWAGPLPVGPAAGLWLGVPAVAAVVLFGLLCRPAGVETA